MTHKVIFIDDFLSHFRLGNNGKTLVPIDKIINFTIEEELEITGATLLSIEEAEEYLPDKERKYDYCWWLRSLGGHSDCAAHVEYDGFVSYDGHAVAYWDDCMRPALQIKNLESSNFEIGDRFKIGNYEFKIISDSLAWMYKQDIGCYAFNGDFEKGNNYETSDIKKFVDKWFRILMFNESEENK